ncbi:efflux transporter periplasmic adaptor subunit [Scytonema hofmannii PCC 7110]|uniref:Efflux transporter periplasmic adaptor subunit n=1 Tax=Scytonema hofmannii PCC 7110 TaxID=128403 RepID=A0A139WR28_9CYAN|nr:efflux RND transporter periplasmic adaptor subunit [Scytonema hofmannii]KYC34872.1 efflux transporter periplasmic adaptor subunit [Scytonema hofmannii PCC 7110]
MHSLEFSQKPTRLRCISGGLLSLLLLSAPEVVLAGAGHNHGSGSEFQGGGEPTGSVEVDAATAKRLEIKVEPVKRQQLAVGIKTTGQIENLPSQKVEVTTPISQAKVIELLVEPGASVKKGQPVAVLTSPDLVTLRVESQEKLAQGEADLQQAQADLRLAQQSYERYQQIAAAEIAEAQSLVAFAQEKSDKDRQLADSGALPRRDALESQTKLAEAKAQLTKASSRRDVIEAENQLKRASAAVDVAKSRIQLSYAAYRTRLQQLGNRANAKGLVTVTAPISGRVADREVTLGQAFEDAGGKLMTIVNDSRVFATANIYEKDLDKVKTGQRVNVKVASVPDRTFTGRITVIGSVVAGDTRVVPVKAEIENLGGVLKPGMFAQLEVLTDQKSRTIVAIPRTAVVEANGQTMVYVQNGQAFQSAEVTLGQTSGDLVEVTSGLFEGDSIVTQRAPQLYAQSLRGGNKPKEGKENVEGHSHSEGEEEAHSQSEETKAETHNYPLPLWLIGALGGTAIATGAFVAGNSWSSRRTRYRTVAVGNSEYNAVPYETEVYLDNHNHKQPTLSSSAVQDEDNKSPHQPN